MGDPERTYYRFSTRPYEPGDVMTPGTFVDDKKASVEQWVEQALEDGRPAAAFRRDAAVYLAKSADQARCFGETEYGQDGFVYEVCAAPIWWAVMCLPDALLKRGQASKDAKAIVGEYWEQKNAWDFLEGLCARATVISVVAPPTPPDWLLRRSGVMMAYGRDRDLVSRLWP